MQGNHAADGKGKPHVGRKYRTMGSGPNLPADTGPSPGDTDFVYEQADIFVNALFGQPNVSLQVLQRINDMKAEALKTRQQMEQEAHLRDIELRKAGGQQMQNVQNLFGSNSVKGEGNMNVGGGSISM